MTASAPRYDPLILEAVRRVDNADLPMAETCRRVGEIAARLDLPRPSYVHLRRIVRAERLRAQQVEGLFVDVLGDALAGRSIRIAEALERSREADAWAQVRRRQG